MEETRRPFLSEAGQFRANGSYISVLSESTGANHDCDPNAEVHFCDESALATLVVRCALRVLALAFGRPC
eukprot:5222440-Pleurochrysis_carterae.AAC.1